MSFHNAVILIGVVLFFAASTTAQAPSYAPYTVACPSTPLISRTGSPTTSNQALPPGEESYITNRRTNVLPNLWASYLADTSTGATGYTLSSFDTGGNYPHLALAISGGGYRASLYGAGTLAALDSRNSTTAGPLLQLSDYLSGLSGGSWAVTSFALNDLPDSFDLVLGQNGEPGWELNMDLLTPGSLNAVEDGEYCESVPVRGTGGEYADLLGDVATKAQTGSPMSIIDIWGRALSYHFFNQTNAANFYQQGAHDQGTLFSSIKYTQNFQAGAMPLPLVVSTSRVDVAQQSEKLSAGDTDVVPLENTQFEFTPFSFGSFDPTLSAYVPTEFAGTFLTDGTPKNASACTNGYENAGFVIGTSSALFNAVEELNLDTTFLELISQLTEDLKTIVQTPDSSIPLVANWPNSFYGFQPATTQFSFESSGNEVLQLTDGGENGENVPLSPLLIPSRSLDIIVAIDGSADTTYNWPNGTSLIATRDRVAIYPENVVGFPPIPASQDDIVAQGLNIRPTFFGCNTTTDGTVTSSGYYPLLVYLPNAPPPTVTSTTYLTNTSTFQLDYSQADALSFLEAAQLNGVKGIPDTAGAADSGWPLCLKCAVFERARKRASVARSAACQACLTKYCWADGVADV